MSEPLLSVRDLSIRFGATEVVDRLSFSIQRGETLGLVGESGCGKSVSSLSLLGLLPQAKVTGSIRLDGQELTTLSQDGWRRIRGRKIAMVFQDPMTALNPLLTVGRHLEEVLSVHKGLRGAPALSEATRWLEKVGIPDPARRLSAHPHELSGGMRQRVLIAMALAGEPDLLVADEPTTALDVTIQAQILELLANLRRELSMSMLFITHDLGVVERVADRLAVLYAGRLAEEGPVEDVLAHPRHPYTEGLLGSVPGFRPRTGRLRSIPGQVPSATDWPAGCRFHPRCDRVQPICRTDEPGLSGNRRVACHFPGEDAR
ncbi:MAG: ABC transporter ATP-binding protein [Fibrobacterota bacterium]|nr:MAG: ABC transporter ATP-binding protein [Fibrobacterota bacterium]